MQALTPKQELFVQEYLVDFNLCAAARRAGYKNPRSGQSQIMKPHVVAAIERAKKERARRVHVDQDKIVYELYAIATAPASDVQKSALKYASKLRALELLGKHLGMFTDKIALTKVDPEAIKTIEGLIDDAARGG